MEERAMSRSRQNLLWLALGAGALTAARAIARKNRRYNFAGRIVWITGGSRGLGLVLARRLAQQGAHLVLTARDQQELDRARADLNSYSDHIITFVCDVTDRGQVEKVVDSVRQLWGKVDVLINNAGVIEVGPLETMTLDDYRESMDIHFWAALYASQAVLPDMRARGSGRIVNIASIGGAISVPHLVPYCASKHALVGLSEGMRTELMRDNIYVTTVCPGLMRTGSHIRAEFKGQHRAEQTLFSIVDALPFTSVSAEQAAAQIIEACRYGDAELVISLPALLADRVHGLFPGATADLLGWINRLLPGSDGTGKERASHAKSMTPLSPSPLTELADAAALRNNEVPMDGRT
jgi:short-subunit dehydrogenase